MFVTVIIIPKKQLIEESRVLTS